MTDHRTCTVGLTVILLSACSNGGGNNSPYGDRNVTPTATVYEQKRSIQCGSPGLGIEQSAQTLITAGIDVIHTDCAYNNLMAVPSVCGAATSEILVHKIPKQNLIDAEAVGFINTDDISNDYSVYDCS